MKKPKPHITVFAGVDLQGDACLYLTKAPGEYLSLKKLDKIAPRLEALLNKGLKRPNDEGVEPTNYFGSDGIVKETL